MEPRAILATGVEPRAVAEAQWSLRVTLGAEARRDLETLTALLGHNVPSGNLAAVLGEALRCAIEKHGVRKGAVAPARGRSVKAAKDAPGGSSPGTRPTIPAEVRRQVFGREHVERFRRGGVGGRPVTQPGRWAQDEVRSSAGSQGVGDFGAHGSPRPARHRDGPSV